MKSGSWYTYGEERLGQGREAAKQYLVDHIEVAAEVELKVREKAGLVATDVAPSDSEQAPVV